MLTTCQVPNAGMFNNVHVSVMTVQVKVYESLLGQGCSLRAPRPSVKYTAECSFVGLNLYLIIILREHVVLCLIFCPIHTATIVHGHKHGLSFK